MLLLHVQLGAGIEVSSGFLLCFTKASKIEIYLSSSFYIYLSIYLYLCDKGEKEHMDALDRRSTLLMWPVNQVFTIVLQAAGDEVSKGQKMSL